MAVSSDSPYAPSPVKVQESRVNGHTGTDSKANVEEHTNGSANGNALQVMPVTVPHPKSSMDTSGSSANAYSVDTTPTEFTGDISTNNELPSQDVLKSVENLQVLDKDGKMLPFKSLYTGPNVARRVLVIFIRHFLCGVRAPSASTHPHPEN
jgi:hypothetical protein